MRARKHLVVERWDRDSFLRFRTPIIALTAVLAALISAGMAPPDERFQPNRLDENPDRAWESDAPEPRTPCTSPARFYDITCFKPGRPCATQNSDVLYNAGRAVCRIKVYKQGPGGGTLMGVCSGFYAVAFDINNNIRNDVVLTSRHCIDHIYSQCLLTPDGINSGGGDVEEPPLPERVVRFELEFGVEYTPDCACAGANPPAACLGDPCRSPTSGPAAPVMPCAGPDTFEGTRWGVEGSCDWVVLIIEPRNGAVLPIQLGWPQLPVFPDFPIFVGTPFNVSVPQHPRGRCREISFGRVRSDSVIVPPQPLETCDFGHNADTEPGSSGSPIVLLKQASPVDPVVASVMGIHRAGGCTTQSATDSSRNRAVGSVVLQSPPATQPAGLPTRFQMAIQRALHPGDFNADGFTDIADRIILWNVLGCGDAANPYNACLDPCYVGYIDLDRSGYIDCFDYLVWLSFYRLEPPGPLNPVDPLPGGGKGDMNQNGRTEGRDIQIFVRTLLLGTPPTLLGQRQRILADFNEDCAVTVADIPPFVAKLLTAP